jgi:hypothetical protein
MKFNMFKIENNNVTYLMTCRRRDIDRACDHMLQRLNIDIDQCEFDCISDHHTIVRIDNDEYQCVESQYECVQS